MPTERFRSCRSAVSKTKFPSATTSHQTPQAGGDSPHLVTIAAARFETQVFETDIGDTHEHTGSFLYFSIAWFWWRELALSHRAKDWQVAEATIESVYRSLGGARETVRVEVWYSYSFDGHSYSGQMIRDTCFNFGAVRNVVARYQKGSKAPIRVNPNNPGESYLASGLGWLEPLLTSFLSIGCLMLLVGVLVSGIISAIRTI